MNFVPDIRTFGLDYNANRGAGGQLTNFAIANNSMAVHCSSFPTGTYKKGHRDGVGAYVRGPGGLRPLRPGVRGPGRGGRAAAAGVQEALTHRRTPWLLSCLSGAEPCGGSRGAR
ncbi:MAG: hypothetical protein IIC31_08355 [Chloroflexi bacterium]|nr:hypothetical protein [Chloroflexota bacterium]